MGSDRVLFHTLDKSIYISIHAPRVGSDTELARRSSGSLNFNPRSPCGERPGTTPTLQGPNLFQSTLPVWGATFIDIIIPDDFLISIHAPRVGSDIKVELQLIVRKISIHAPRVGSDLPAGRSRPVGPRISIHAPRVGSDSGTSSLRREASSFQSTLPVWGATQSAPVGVAYIRIFQSTLPVWGATGLFYLLHLVSRPFQSTLPVWGATLLALVYQCPADIFQSTLPVWGATRLLSLASKPIFHFNPRSPCGERRAALIHGQKHGQISIHAPRVGSDGPRSREALHTGRFQSTLPVWGATDIT